MSRDVTAQIESRLVDGDAHDRVEALDVLTHALEFTGAEDALTIWREALHRRQVSERTTAALDELVDYLLNETAKGNHDAASQICDCLGFIGADADRIPAGGD